MKDPKITLTSLLMASAFLCTALIGCKSEPNSAPEETAVPENTVTSNEPSYKEVYQSQIQYYEELIRDLEDKLLKEKENGYISNAEHQLQINELQSNIAALNERLEALSNQNQTQSPTLSTTHQAPTTDRETEPESNNIYNNEENHPTTEQLTHKASYKYEVKNGCITITSYTGNDKSVFIPSVIDGMKVTSIGEEAFKSCQVERVVIPDTVTYIDWFAFYSCKNLCEITLPASITTIAHGAFDLCSENLIIKCKKNSYAQAYAQSWGFIAITE